MALTDEGGNMVMPVSPMYGNGYGGGNGLFGSDATMDGVASAAATTVRLSLQTMFSVDLTSQR